MILNFKLLGGLRAPFQYLLRKFVVLCKSCPAFAGFSSTASIIKRAEIDKMNFKT